LQVANIQGFDSDGSIVIGRYYSWLLVGLLIITSAQANDYVINPESGDAEIRFEVKQLGLRWLRGEFEKFHGQYSYSPQSPENSAIQVIIDMNSVTTDNLQIAKVIKSPELLDAEQFPTASFQSSGFEIHDQENALITGLFTLHGVSKEISFPVKKIQNENSTGFAGQTSLKLADYDIIFDLGPASPMINVHMKIHGTLAEASTAGQ